MLKCENCLCCAISLNGMKLESFCQCFLFSLIRNSDLEFVAFNFIALISQIKLDDKTYY